MGNQQNSGEMRHVFKFWQDHVDVEVCCGMESVYILDQWEKQFHVWKGVSILSSLPWLRDIWARVHKPLTITKCSPKVY
jgi:hypothetical protein